ncbi:Arc family DNA-binding protein [Celeribacter halophilus]|uniref:Arc family DNA-binding protein n=1 Tax=Celeribacter halophilus TaxID=576117 RepID=UPI003A91DA24
MAKTPSSEQVQVNFRMPEDLRDRIKAAAEQHNRSMNAEIVATLAEKYPPKFIDAEALAEFLNGLSCSFIAENDEEAAENREYISKVNDLLSKTKHPFTVEIDMGMIKLYPYPTPMKPAKDDSK